MRVPPILACLTLVVGSSCSDASGPGSDLPGGRDLEVTTTEWTPDAEGDRFARPLPQGEVEEPDAEELDHERREAWIESMHRAAPDVDWRRIERANAQAETERRNRLGRQFGAKALGGVWQEVGSSNQAGRMMTAAHGRDGMTLYGGSALGGLWRADLAGNGWEPLSDNRFGGVRGIVVLDPEVAGGPEILVIEDGTGVAVTRDEGLTWETPQGLGAVNSVRRLLRLEDASETILVAVMKDNGPNERFAVFGSTDGGRSFQERFLGGQDYAGDLWVPRQGAAAQDTAYLLNAGQLRRSTNGGQSFPILSTFSGSSDGGRLAGSEAGAFYAMLDEGGADRLYASYDNGQTTQFVKNIANTWGPLVASISDPQRVMHGNIEAWRSTNGGTGFAKVNGWPEYYNDPANKLHADMMGFVVLPDPQNPGSEVWYACTDGGIFASRDLAVSWSNLSLTGLGVSQYYSTHTSVLDPDLLVAGSQDQGYQRGFVQPPLASGPSTPLEQVISGDYAQLTSSDGSHDYLYSTYPGFLFVQVGETQPGIQYFQVSFPPGAPAPWLPELLADPTDKTAFYFGSDVLYRYHRTGSNWTLNQHSSQVFESSGYISALGVAPTDSQRMVAATNQGRIFTSGDAGVTWQLRSTGAPGSYFLHGQCAVFHPTNANEIVVAGSGYSTPGVVRTLDGGASWSSITNGLPATLTYGIAYAPDGSGDLYAGTETGPWRWRRSNQTWEPIGGNEAPVTIYWSVETVGNDTVRFGTYGRGIWDFAVPTLASAYPYGQGKVNIHGIENTLASSGTPSVTSNDFKLETWGGMAGKPGIVIWADESGFLPFGGGTLWVKPPIQRDTPFAYDALGQATIPVPVTFSVGGVERHYQIWSRDPGNPDGSGVLLSNGLRVRFGF